MKLKHEVIKLTPQEAKLWSDTRVALLWHCPAFSHLLYSMLDTVGQDTVALFTKEIPIAATDGFCLLLNPETFFKYDLNERVFIVAHEVMHCVYAHCCLMHAFKRRGKVGFPDGSALDYVGEYMNYATDLVINDVLIESDVGQFNADWIHDTSMGTQMESALDVYKKLYKAQPPKKGKLVMQGTSFDEHLNPGDAKDGTDPTQESQNRNKAEWDMAVAAAANAAKVQGKLPAGLERLFGEILNPQVDWREKIQALFARRLGSGSYDWRRPDRRLITRDIYAPGRSGFGAGTVVIGADTSGSIGGKELDMFFAEVAGILEDIRPQTLYLIWCDASVNRVDECNEPADLNDLRCKGAPGGGGTAFEPVFDWIHENGIEPDALVYLTDGYGSFPDKAPSYPVIWGNIAEHENFPFGDIVQIPKQA